MSAERVRALRKNPTDAERTPGRQLRLRQLEGQKFRRQQPLGEYIVDFVCLEKKLIVELDGGQHAKRAASDAVRTAWREAQGFRVLRFWNHDVLKDIAAVKEVIGRTLSQV
jgi:very-short-patch-repair endonuclease